MHITLDKELFIKEWNSYTQYKNFCSDYLKEKIFKDQCSYEFTKSKEFDLSLILEDYDVMSVSCYKKLFSLKRLIEGSNEVIGIDKNTNTVVYRYP